MKTENTGLDLTVTMSKCTAEMSNDEIEKLDRSFAHKENLDQPIKRDNWKASLDNEQTEVTPPDDNISGEDLKQAQNE